MKSVKNTPGYVKILIPVFLFWNVQIYATEQNISIYSKLNAKKIAATVFLPENYQKSGKHYPTVYLLHGYGGNPENWKRVAPLQQLADLHELVFVCADAKNSWYIDSPQNHKSNFESFFIKELIPTIDSSFRTINNRTKRALCGISMGGHGALTLIAKYPELFCAATSICGIIDLSEFPDRWELSSVLGPLEKNKQKWNDHSFISLYKNLKAKNCAIAIDCGISDFALPANRRVHSLMMESGIEHDYFERPGTHNLEYPLRVFKYHLVFLTEHFN